MKTGFDEKSTSKLLTERQRIWRELMDVCEEHTLRSISNLIEIEIELVSREGM